MTERHKMLAGELYNPLDPDLVAARERARDLCQTLNQTRESEQELRRGLLSDLFGAGGDTFGSNHPSIATTVQTSILGRGCSSTSTA
jgi:maltose O-acetyltransferase